jgi:hypothetical protein
VSPAFGAELLTVAVHSKVWGAETNSADQLAFIS